VQLAKLAHQHLAVEVQGLFVDAVSPVRGDVFGKARGHAVAPLQVRSMKDVEKA
jgi:hypothetical protein